MITSDQERRLQRLEAYVVEETAKTPRAFWDGFQAIAEDLDKAVFAEDADAELIERYTTLLANADDAGFAVPEEAMDGPFEQQSPLASVFVRPVCVIVETAQD